MCCKTICNSFNKLNMWAIDSLKSWNSLFLKWTYWYLINNPSLHPQPTHEKDWTCYRVCQRSWPSLIVADEDIEPQNFWASSKSHVATTYFCIQFCSNYIGLSNQGKYYEIEVQFAKQDVATWLFDEANIFQFDIFVRKQRPTG